MRRNKTKVFFLYGLELYTKELDAEGNTATSQILHLGDKIRLDFDPAAWEFIDESYGVTK